jgi:hypothetical protein
MINALGTELLEMIGKSTSELPVMFDRELLHMTIDPLGMLKSLRSMRLSEL